MTWATLPTDIQNLAERELTQAQLAAWKLELAGWGTRRIGLHLAISRGAVRDRLDLAHLALLNAGATQDPAGHWHLTKETTPA